MSGTNGGVVMFVIVAVWLAAAKPKLGTPPLWVGDDQEIPV